MSSEASNYTVTNVTLPEEDGSGVTSEWRGLAGILWIYCSPIIFVTGCVGNILILVIMGRRRFQGTTTCVYLRGMAFFDFLTLLTGMIPEWLSANEIIVFKEISPATCKLEKFVSYTVADTAIWILVAFTIDRFVAVCFPFYKSLICKPHRARFVCLGLLLFAFVKNIHVIFTRGAEYIDEDGTKILDSNCAKPEPFKYFEKFIRPWIVFTLISIIPFVVILLCNTMIIRTLVSARKLHQEQHMAKDKAYMQMTLMCLSASFAFLLTITPSIVLLIGKPYWKRPDNVAYIIAKAINNQLVYVNHSINFFLYCITGKRFRTELCRICHRDNVQSHSHWADTPETKRTPLVKMKVPHNQLIQAGESSGYMSAEGGDNGVYKLVREPESESCI